MKELGEISFCPYVGLDPYTEADSDYFFGRQQDSQVIASNLYAARLTILYGASAVGKSSILTAGVIPLLRKKPRTVVILFRDWQSPLFLSALKTECIKAIEKIASKRPTLSPSMPLDDLLAAGAASFGGSILLLFDQFEEYLAFHSTEAADAPFEVEFARSVNRDDVDVSFLISLREEGLARLDRFRVRIPNLLANTLQLQNLDRESAEMAIWGPLKVYNERFSTAAGPVVLEDELAKEILSQVQIGSVVLSRTSGTGQGQAGEESGRIETAFLQLVMERLWQEEVSATSREIRLATFKRFGGAENIVRSHVDGVMKRLGSRERRACARFFDRLVTPSGIKISYTMEDLKMFAGKLAQHLPSVVRQLSAARILREVGNAEGDQNAARYQIFHDVLGPAVLAWNTLYAERKRRRKRLALLLGSMFSILLLGGWLSVFSFRNHAKEAEYRASEYEGGKRYDLALSSLQDALRSYRVGFDRSSELRVLKSIERVQSLYLPWGYLTDLWSGQVHELHGERVNIGRNTSANEANNEIDIQDRLVSRRHLAFTRDGQVAEDLRSRNGTTLNSRTIPYGVGAKIEDGDLISLAGVVAFRFTKEWPTGLLPLPQETWGVFIDGTSRSVEYLTEREYEIVASGGKLSVHHPAVKEALMRIRRTLDSAMLYDVADDWYVRLTQKETDYEYKSYVLNSQYWVPMFTQPLEYLKLSSDRQRIDTSYAFQFVCIKQVED